MSKCRVLKVRTKSVGKHRKFSLWLGLISSADAGACERSRLMLVPLYGVTRSKEGLGVKTTTAERTRDIVVLLTFNVLRPVAACRKRVGEKGTSDRRRKFQQGGLIWSGKSAISP